MLETNNIKLSVSRAFEVHEQHVVVSATATHDSVGFNISINHPDYSYLNWKMLVKPEADKVDCPVTGLSTTTCNLSPKLPLCEKCPLGQ